MSAGKLSDGARMLVGVACLLAPIVAFLAAFAGAISWGAAFASLAMTTVAAVALALAE